MDWFVLQHRLPSGRTAVEEFVAAHPELPEEERALLLGWREVVEGLFEVRRRDGEALATVSLIDDFGELPAELVEADTVAVVYDEVEGLSFLARFGLLQATFADPGLAAGREHRQAVVDYLNDPSVSPLAFRRLAAPDPGRASEVVRRALRQPGFSWERDGEALLRRHTGGRSRVRASKGGR